MKKFIRISCLLLAIVGLMTFTSCKDKEGNEGKDQGVKEGTYKATEGLLVYYIYSEAASISEEEIKEHNFDVEKSLKEQMYDETYTWYEILIIKAENALTYLLTYCNAAAEEGVTLDQSDNAAIEDTLYQKRVSAAVEGYELDDYLAYYYNNSYVTEAVLKNLYELQYLSAKYADILETRFNESLTDAMVDDQLKESGGTDTTLTRDLGIIVFSPEKYDSIDGAKAQAQSVLQNMIAEGPITKESFENYAEENSESKDVYFINVAEGDMQTEINDWLYGVSTRSVGDIGVITADYGASIVYYESEGDPINVAEAKLALVDKMFEEWYNETKSLYKTGLTEELIEGLELDF